MEPLQVEVGNAEDVRAAAAEEQRAGRRTVFLLVVGVMCVSMVLLWPASFTSGVARIAGKSLRPAGEQDPYVRFNTPAFSPRTVGSSSSNARSRGPPLPQLATPFRPMPAVPGVARFATTMQMSATDTDEQIKSADVVFFAKAGCPFCKKAAAALSASGIEFKEIPIESYKDSLEAKTGKTSAPSVWIKGEYIGGCNDGAKDGDGVIPMVKSGKLREMVGLPALSAEEIANIVDPPKKGAIDGVAGVGDRIPDVDLDDGFPPTPFGLKGFCKDKTVVIVGLPGAFTTTWSGKQIPAYLNQQAELKAAGVDEVLVYCVNDGAVMTGWAKDQGIEGSMIKFLGDPRSELTKSLGLVLDDPGPMGVLGNPRCKRHSILVKNGVIKAINVAEGPGDPAGDAEPDLSMPDQILKDLARLAKVAKVGDPIPDVSLDLGFPPEPFGLKEFCKDKKVVIVGLPGAFTPTWSSKQIPEYLNQQAELKAAGVDAVLVYCVNDGAVMTAWAKDQGVEGSMIQLLGDTRSELTEALGLVLDHPGPMGVLGNPRCKRHSILVDHGIIKAINVAEGPDDPAGDGNPDAAMPAQMLKDLAA